MKGTPTSISTDNALETAKTLRETSASPHDPLSLAADMLTSLCKERDALASLGEASYRCTDCGASHPGPAPYKAYIVCTACGKHSAATAALRPPQPLNDIRAEAIRKVAMKRPPGSVQRAWLLEQADEALTGEL